jgi:hypothetical protein
MRLPGGKRVDAGVDGFVIQTDQPRETSVAEASGDGRRGAA